MRKSPHLRGKTSVVDAPQKLIVHRTKRRRTEVLCFGMSGKHMRRLQLELRHSRFSCVRCTVRCRFARHDAASPWQWADALQNPVATPLRMLRGQASVISCRFCALWSHETAVGD
ncbi:hypothetical protein MKK68_16395 [Methylobacterium sp. E-016]|uniref:hypothetical protein n=1 Tax=Methylobacterium sp. E-016 TaxID=2836556 RepID=UPI001FBACCAF|nr:hypothetical protein [Methylobacterium sp. E-016]MCJ2077208.1 hypothetical protein [Methylobacterium sp. E-016]